MYPGVLAAKVSDFGSNLLKCYSSRWAPNLLKSATWPLAPSNVLKSACRVAAIHKKVITSQKGLRSTGGPDLLKWGLPGGGIKSAKVAPTPYV